MKKILVFAAFMLAMCATTSAQVVKNGNTFSVASNRGHKAVKDTVVTKYKFTDSKGVEYPIILNKKNGVCYIWKKSAKSGKFYIQYFTTDKTIDISKQIAKEYGVPFTYVKKAKTDNK